jgi:hypothetical protein
MSVFNRLIHRPASGRPAWLLPGLIVAFLVGCGETNPLSGVQLYPVKGKVLLTDGKPLSSGKVVFVGDKTTFTSTANIDDDGSFEFKAGDRNGLPEGDYRVRLEATATKTTSGRGKNDLPFAPRYLDEDGSHLRATVTPEATKNTFEFKLDAKDLASSTSTSRGGK